MTHPGADVDPAEAMLAELAGLDLSLARHVHACAMTTEDPSEVADLARAYQRIARSLRQSLALHARLKRDRERGERETPPTPTPACDPARVAERKAQLRTAARRAVWAEYESEPDEALECFRLIERRLDLDEVSDHDPLDDHVVRVCRSLGLPEAIARAWRDLPDPPGPLPPPFTGDHGPKPAEAGCRARGGGGEPRPPSPQPPIDPPLADDPVPRRPLESSA
jgi:hypothetical protein